MKVVMTGWACAWLVLGFLAAVVARGTAAAQADSELEGVSGSHDVATWSDYCDPTAAHIIVREAMRPTAAPSGEHTTERLVAGINTMLARRDLLCVAQQRWELLHEELPWLVPPYPVQPAAWRGEG